MKELGDLRDGTGTHKQTFLAERAWRAWKKRERNLFRPGNQSTEALVGGMVLGYTVAAFCAGWLLGALVVNNFQRTGSGPLDIMDPVPCHAPTGAQYGDQP